MSSESSIVIAAAAALNNELTCAADADGGGDKNKERLCRRSRKCSKLFIHVGPCNKNRVNNFWKHSPIQRKHTLVQECTSLGEKVEKQEAEIIVLNTEVYDLTNEKQDMETNITTLRSEREEEGNVLKECQEQYNKIKLLLEQKGYARKRRINNQTTEEMIKDPTKKSCRYRRREESKNIMEFIHGGSEGCVFGTWDLMISIATESQIEHLVKTYKRGKFLEKLYGRMTDALSKSSSGINKAVATKYANYLSRRKYNMVCKIQNSTFTKDGVVKGHQIEYGDKNINFKTLQISDRTVEQFVKSLNIGDIHVIQGYSGVLRTVTALVTMIADLHLKVKSLKDKLMWFKSNTNHFVIEFSDDGAPESREKTMTIGTLSMWNFGKRIRSRSFHYPLHMITASEKDEVCELIWKQYASEMELIEGNVLKINNENVTFEFVPAADIAWLCFSTNVLPTSASYPSPFANVHKSELSVRNGTIGGENSTWTVPTMENRREEIRSIDEFKSTLSESLSHSQKHSRVLSFMAEQGYRQLGEPRIGIFADRIRPEPLHMEINNWQHVLDLIYKESVRRGCFDKFIDVLKSPPKESDTKGCGLKFIAKGIEEHYQNEKKRLNKLSVRLIGDQVISLAQYSFRLIDVLEVNEEKENEKLKRLALGKICQSLRDIGELINQVDVNQNYVDNVNKACKLYFHLFSLFFPDSCQSTVWTMGYIIPYGVKELFTQYEVGYGILSMQGKESLHSAIKQQLKSNSNRSVSQNEEGKWYQLMRANYVRSFYLPYHFPSISNYRSHFRPRRPTELVEVCDCSRRLQSEFLCSFCINSSPVLNCVEQNGFTEEVLMQLKPELCMKCGERFSDKNKLTQHMNYHVLLVKSAIVPEIMSIKELKNELRLLGKPLSGNKKELIKRLEGAITKR